MASAGHQYSKQSLANHKLLRMLLLLLLDQKAMLQDLLLETQVAMLLELPKANPLVI
jgi:hypothetical protein